MKVMFLDESGDHSLVKIDQSYPMFVLAGCIFNVDYIEELEKRVNNLKLKYFGKTDVILRSYDIRKQKREFSCLIDSQLRQKFYDDLNQLISQLDFSIIAVAINKLKLKKIYSDPDNPYNLCLQFILERSMMYLGKTQEKIMFRIESRETHNDQKLATEYENFRNNSNTFFLQEERISKLIDLSFNQKSQNVAGMQLADLVAYPIGKWVLDQNKDNPSFRVISSKVHNKNGQILNYGLKIFP